MHGPGLPGPVPLDIRIHHSQQHATVRLAGEVDMVTAGQLSDVLGGLFDDGWRKVEVDLSGVVFLAAAGLAVLVEQDRRYRDATGCLSITRPSAVCARLFALTHLRAILTIH